MCSVGQLYPSLFNPMDSSSPGPSVHGIFQARTLKWVAISSSRGSSNPGVEAVPCVFHVAGGFFTAEPLGKPIKNTGIVLNLQIKSGGDCDPGQYLDHSLLRDPGQKGGSWEAAPGFLSYRIYEIIME